MIDNELYLEDIQHISDFVSGWEKLIDSTLLVTGATGLMGSLLIDTIMFKNENDDLRCKIFAVGRNEERAKNRFGHYFSSKYFKFIKQDINKPFEHDLGDVDYIIHLASNTHPRKYAEHPIETITTNVIGTNNLLEFATKSNTKRFLFASSNEIYGQNKGDVELFDESYCGYIDSNTLRAGYPESKRCGEALCQAYLKEKDLDVVIARLTRSYGPTLLKDDSKAMTQFIRNAINHENIVLKSKGEQYFSYAYVADSISGLLFVLLKGECGEAYNIADEKSDIKLKDLAATIANYVGTKVIFELPDSVESQGFSKATKARLDGTKIKNLGWEMKYTIEDGLKRTIDVLNK